MPLIQQRSRIPYRSTVSCTFISPSVIRNGGRIFTRPRKVKVAYELDTFGYRVQPSRNANEIPLDAAILNPFRFSGFNLRRLHIARCVFRARETDPAIIETLSHSRREDAAYPRGCCREPPFRFTAVWRENLSLLNAPALSVPDLTRGRDYRGGGKKKKR